MKASNHTAIIDGVNLKVRKGQTILDAAQKAGIYIPTLCHLKGLPDYGACRLCLVEMERRNSTIVKASCTLVAQPGMVVIPSNNPGLRPNRPRPWTMGRALPRP